MEGEALTTEFRADFKGEIESLEWAAFERGKTDGAAAERERIKAVEAQAVPGHEALIAELKFDGKTTGPEAAVKVLAAEKEKRGKVLSDLKADAPNPVPHAEAPTPAGAPEEQQATAESAATVEQARKAGLIR